MAAPPGPKPTPLWWGAAAVAATLLSSVVDADDASPADLPAAPSDPAATVQGQSAIFALLRGMLQKVRRVTLQSDTWYAPVAPGLSIVTVSHPNPSRLLAQQSRARGITIDTLPLDVTLRFPGACVAELQQVLHCSGFTAPLVPGGAVHVSCPKSSPSTGPGGRQLGGAGQVWTAVDPGQAQWPPAHEYRIEHTGADGSRLAMLTVSVPEGHVSLHVPAEGAPQIALYNMARALAASWALRLPTTADTSAVKTMLQQPLGRSSSPMASVEYNPLEAAAAAGGRPSAQLPALVKEFPEEFQCWVQKHSIALAPEWCYWRAVMAALDDTVQSSLRSRGDERPSAQTFNDLGLPPAIKHTAAALQWAEDAPQRQVWMASAFLGWLFQHWAEHQATAGRGAGTEPPLPVEAVPAHLTPWTKSSGFTPSPAHLRQAAVGYMERFLADAGLLEKSREMLLLDTYLKVLLGKELSKLAQGLAGKTGGMRMMPPGASPFAPPGAFHGGAQRMPKQGGDEESDSAVVHGDDVPPELADLPCEVYTRDSHVVDGVDWGALAGYPAVRQAVEENILLPRAHPEVFAQVEGAARGGGKTRTAPDGTPLSTHLSGCYLFCGPPGTGKTTTARVLAAKSDVPLVCLSFESIASSLYGKSQKKLDQVLRRLSSLPKGAVLFIDEADTFFPHRGRRGQHSSDAYDSRHLSIFLKWLEGINAKSASKIVVILASNREQSLDPALRSRVALTLQFDLPDEEARGAIWGKYAQHLNAEQRKQLVQASDGFSARDILRTAEIAERRHATHMVQAAEGAGDTEEGSREQDLSFAQGFAPGVQEYLYACEDKASGIVTSGGDGQGPSKGDKEGSQQNKRGRRRSALPRSGQYGSKV